MCVYMCAYENQRLSVILLLLGLCVCVFVCKSMNMHLCGQACRGQRLTLGVFLSQYPFYLLRLSHWMTQELADSG